MIIQTAVGPMDESDLIKRIDKDETEDWSSEAVEYCVKGCHGQAHVFNRADGPGVFCRFNVKRQPTVTLKKFSEMLGAILGELK